jgi:hypothetical protein
MAFVTRQEIEGRTGGSRIRLDQDVEVLAGIMKKGSVLEFVESDGRENWYRDVDSGQKIGLVPGWHRHTVL